MIIRTDILYPIHTSLPPRGLFRSIACVLIPAFAVTVERLAKPWPADRPLVVYDRNTVLDVSPEAGGVRRGLPLRLAKATCPQAVFVEANHALYREVAEAVLDALESVAPLVEPAGPGCAHADIRGLQGHYEDEFALAGALMEAVQSATGLLASVGIADGKFVAVVGADVSRRDGGAGARLMGRLMAAAPLSGRVSVSLGQQRRGLLPRAAGRAVQR